MANSILTPETPILIADDSVQFAQVLRSLLSKVFGFTNITAVPSTADAHRLIQNDPLKFKLVFLDFHFPTGMNGGELLRQLDHDELLAGLYIFLMTSDPTPEVLARAREAGAMGVITKPFDRDELRRQLDAAERRAQADSGFSI